MHASAEEEGREEEEGWEGKGAEGPAAALSTGWIASDELEKETEEKEKEKADCPALLILEVSTETCEEDLCLSSLMMLLEARARVAVELPTV